MNEKSSKIIKSGMKIGVIVSMVPVAIVCIVLFWPTSRGAVNIKTGLSARLLFMIFIGFIIGFFNGSIITYLEKSTKNIKKWGIIIAGAISCVAIALSFYLYFKPTSNSYGVMVIGLVGFYAPLLAIGTLYGKDIRIYLDYIKE